MNDLYQAAARIQEALRAEGWNFCFIGGLAVQHWGEPRFTRDIDASLLTGLGGENAYIKRLEKWLPSREPDPVAFAMETRIYLGLFQGRVPVDISLAGDQFEERVLARSVEADYAPGARLCVCCAEDLVTYKVFAGRPVDWQDVEGILLRQKGKLKWGVIESELEPLLELKEDFEAFGRLQELRRKVG